MRERWSLISRLLTSMAALVAAVAFFVFALGNATMTHADQVDHPNGRYQLNTIVIDDSIAYYMVDTATGTVYYRTPATNYRWMRSGAMFDPQRLNMAHE